MEVDEAIQKTLNTEGWSRQAPEPTPAPLSQQETDKMVFDSVIRNKKVEQQIEEDERGPRKPPDQKQVKSHTERVLRQATELHGLVRPDDKSSSDCKRCHRYFPTSLLRMTKTGHGKDDWQGHIPCSCLCCDQGFVAYGDEDGELIEVAWPEGPSKDPLFDINQAESSRLKLPLRAVKALFLESSHLQHNFRSYEGAADQRWWDSEASWGFYRDNEMARAIAAKDQDMDDDSSTGKWSYGRDWHWDNYDNNHKGMEKQMASLQIEKGWSNKWSDSSWSSSDSYSTKRKYEDESTPVWYKGDPAERLRRFTIECRRLWTERSKRKGRCYQTARTKDFSRHRELMVKDLMEQGLTDADGKLPTNAAGRRRIAELVVGKIQEAVEAFTIGMANTTSGTPTWRR